MSSLLHALGRWAVDHRRRVIIGWLAALVIVGAAAGLFQRDMADVLEIPGTQSQQAWDALGARFPEFAGASASVVVTAPEGQRVTDPANRAQVETLTGEYAALPHVRGATSPFDEQVRGTVSPDESTAIIAVQLDVESESVTPEIREPILQLAERSSTGGLTAEVGGSIFMPTPPEISPTEGIGVLVSFGVLLVTLGSMIAAGIPLLTALAGIAMSISLILLATRVADITDTALLLALMIGLAVGIDYALFVISRHRDLLAVGLAPREAVAQATGTAGSAVVFAGSTVAIALLALAVADIPFLTVMGVAAAGAVGVAVVAALTLLPAVLGATGSRLTPKHVADAHHARRHTGWSATWVRTVTRVPLVPVLLVLVTLGALTLPARDLALSLPNNGTSAPTSTQRLAHDRIAEAFGPGANAPLLVTVDIVATTDPVGVVEQIEQLVQQTPDVVGTTLATPNRSADTGVIVAIPAGGADSPEAAHALEELRALAPEVADRFGVELAVTGHTAAEVDIADRLGAALLPFGLVVVGLSLVLLALVFRSVLVPVTAALGYLLSVGSAFGVTVAVTQWGWFAGPLGVTDTGPIIAFMPIIVMGVLFGLAMDYQVFLVSSMRARFVHEGDARAAVQHGFVDSAKVVTAAAVIMVSVFGAFVPEGAVYIKPIALGLTVGVFVDAFIVRLTLVPALMTLMGRAAWWLPRWLDRALPALDVEGESLHRRLATAEQTSAEGAPVIRAEGLGLAATTGFETSARSGKTSVLSDLDLTAAPGTLVVVHGPHGSGKTPLLLTLAGRMRHTEGKLVVVGRLLPDEAAAVRRRTSLAEFSGVNDLDPLLTIGDHLDERLAAATWHPWVSASARDQARDQLNLLLGQAAQATTGGSSAGGHARRSIPVATKIAQLNPLERWVLGIALALIGDPQIVLVDDVDALRGRDDRAAAWAVLAQLGRLTGRVELTVVAACREPDEASAVCRALGTAAAPLHVIATTPTPHALQVTT